MCLKANSYGLRQLPHHTESAIRYTWEINHFCKGNKTVYTIRISFTEVEWI